MPADMKGAEPLNEANGEAMFNVIMATGLSPEMIESFLVSDSDLDAMCDAVLLELAEARRMTPQNNAKR